MMSNVVQIGTHTRTGRSRPSTSDAEVYTVKEVARLLRISLGSAYALVRDGTIPAKKVGARWVVPRQRFHNWLNAPDPTETDRAATGGSGR